MTLWTDLHKSRNLISRTFYGTPGVQTITAPAGAGIIRASAVGAGAWRTNNFGGGAAFARVKTTCTPAEQFQIQVGDIAHTLDTGDSAGDSVVTRVTGTVVILKAVRAIGAAGGLSTSCVGDTKRSGSSTGGTTIGGTSGGDDGDTFALGFGGRGYYQDRFSQKFLAAAPGGGGAKAYPVYQSFDGSYVIPFNLPPGNGRVCIEFFKTDPGYS